MVEELIELIVKIVLLFSPLIIASIVKKIIYKHTGSMNNIPITICQVVIDCFKALIWMSILYYIVLKLAIVGKSIYMLMGFATSPYAPLIIILELLFVALKAIFNDYRCSNNQLFTLIRNISNIGSWICVILFIPVISMLFIFILPILIPIFGLSVIENKKLFSNVIYTVLRIIFKVILVVIIIIYVIVALSFISGFLPQEFKDVLESIISKANNSININIGKDVVKDVFP